MPTMTPQEIVLCLDAVIVASEGLRQHLPDHLQVALTLLEDEVDKYIEAGQDTENALGSTLFFEHLAAQKAAVDKLASNPQVFGCE
jgi:hypothetical protein